ncbi:MAG: hypothetical protein LUF35_06165 [Lachnospiraceae bacterium]|nr:hypothetical protein [Lachnospiraceae bacterium]
MKKNSLKAVLPLLLAGACLAGGTATAFAEEETSLAPTVLEDKAVEPNPYIGSLDATIHNDPYGTDVISSVQSLGIYPEVNYGEEPTSYNATPNAFFDDDGLAVCTYLSGFAIKDLSMDTVELLGSFIPAQHDEESYNIQTPYSFCDSDGNVVCPTSHGHVMIMQTKDEDGNVLEVFEKLLDVDIVSEAVAVLGDDIDTNLLSIIYDYDGNLWFVSGGFRKNPEYSDDGFVGYLSRAYIDAVLAGEEADLTENTFFLRLTEGENAENGIASCPSGVVILTNKSCYLFTADESGGVETNWKVDYESEDKAPLEGSEVTGIGLAWGGGSSPTLTNELVLFTDNCYPVNLIAVSMETGEVVAQTAVLDSLTGTEQVSVENSIIAYSSSEELTSVVVCNWFGAGNSGLNDPDADSSIQTYENIYDANWMAEGNEYISPGAERIDVIKDGDSYRMEVVWTREDIRDTSMLKLSTATGYLYGYWQNLETGYWCYYVLDFETGETVLEVPVSDDASFNNMAVGMIADVSGNALYAPTNAKILLRLQDRFVYLPNFTDVEVDLDQTERILLSDEDFAEASDTEETPVTYLHTAVIDALEEDNVIAFRMNGISGVEAGELCLFVMEGDGSLLHAEEDCWEIKTEDGEVVDAEEEMDADTLYEIHVTVQDQSDYDQDEEEGTIRISVILAAAEGRGEGE